MRLQYVESFVSLVHKVKVLPTRTSFYMFLQKPFIDVLSVQQSRMLHIVSLKVLWTGQSGIQS